jgi:restriction system protein
MRFWVVRAGKHGQNESHALERGVVLIGWDDVGDLSSAANRDVLQRLIETTYPDESLGTQRIWTGELWAFKERIQVGDWVALPLKSRSAIAIGQIAGAYKYVPDGPESGKHQHDVRWVRTDLPRAEVDQDLLYTLGSTLTVFRARRNDAGERLVSLVQGDRGATTASPQEPEAVEQDELRSVDLEQFAADQIEKSIGRKFRGHELARLVAAILSAEGYQVQVSKPGADGGVDIIAGSGPMGFGHPRIAVQVKSGDATADVSVLRELQGVMPRFGADHGLIVSWAGFKDSVFREARQLFFEVRLWDSGDLVEALKRNYERLSEDIQAELPLKRIWLLAEPSE